jgi:hypothetical protein
VPVKVAVPEVTAILATRVVVVLAPVIVEVPVTEAVPALMFQAVVTPLVLGWFKVKFPPTDKLAFPVWVKEVFVEAALNTRSTQLLVVPVSNERLDPEAMVTSGKAVLPDPPMVLFAPLKVTVLVPPLRVPPLLVQFPATAMLPASVTVTPESIWTLPKVMAAVGVTVPDPSNCARLVAFNMRAVLLTVKLPPNFMVSPALVVNVPPDLV